MTTRENQIKRVVQILTDDYSPGLSDMGWDRYYDLEIYPIANDLYEFETDALIRRLLKETPVEEEVR